MPEKILRALISFSCLAPVRGVGKKLSYNKSILPRGEVVERVCQRVMDFYAERKVESALVSRTAKTYQGIYFRNQIKTIKEKLADETFEAPALREKLNNRLARYRKEKEELSSCDGPKETIAFLARYYAEDIAADFEPAFFSIFKHMAYKLFPNFASSIQISENGDGTFEAIRKLMWEAPVLFMPNHISNADHIPICMTLNQMRLPQPRIAVGANLFRGISAVLLSRVNGYKIRREYVGQSEGVLGGIKWFQNPVYKHVHTEYLKQGWDNNEPLMFYIEGTRSRDGSLGKPKLGILGDALEYAKETGRTLYVVPISISYSIVPEDKDIEASRKGENISHKDLLSQLRGMDRGFKKYASGGIHLRFSPPVALNAETKSLSSFAGDVMETISSEVVTMTTSALAASILKVKHKTLTGRTFHLSDLMDDFISLLDKRIAGKGTPEDQLNGAVDIFKGRGFIKDTGNGEAFELLDEPLILQYANRIAHRVDWL